MEEDVIKEYSRYFNERTLSMEARNNKDYCKKYSEKELIERNTFKGVEYLKYLIYTLSFTPFILWIVLLSKILRHGKTEDIGFGAFMMSIFCLGICMKIYDYLLKVIIKIRVRKI